MTADLCSICGGDHDRISREDAPDCYDATHRRDRPQAGKKRHVRVRTPGAAFEVPEAVAAALGTANLVVRFWNELAATEIHHELRRRGDLALAWCESPKGECPELNARNLEVLADFALASRRVEEIVIGYTAATLDLRDSALHNRQTKASTNDGQATQ